MLVLVNMCINPESSPEHLQMMQISQNFCQVEIQLLEMDITQKKTPEIINTNCLKSQHFKYYLLPYKELNLQLNPSIKMSLLGTNLSVLHMTRERSSRPFALFIVLFF